MNGMMMQRKQNRMRLLMAACSLGMVVGFSQVGVAQQAVGKSAASQQQPAMSASAAEPEASAFAPASFSALMPGMAATRPAAKPAVEDEEESTQPSKPGAEGIKIHGHWVLQMKNPDGTLGERREFNNSLITTNTPGSSSSGSAVLAAILSGNVTVADPAIGILQGTLSADPSLFCLSVLSNQTCYLFTDAGSFWNNPGLVIPSASGYGVQGIQLGMSKTVTFTPSASIGLSGNFTVPTGLTSIGGVQLLYSGCQTKTFGISYGPSDSLGGVTGFSSADTGPSACNSSASIPSDMPFIGAVTSTTVPGGPMTVTPGQVLSITFTLSFS
jgi:hypothetical protein